MPSFDIGNRFGLRVRLIAIISALTVILVFLIGLVVLKIAEHNFLRQKIEVGDIAISGIQSALDTYWPSNQSFETGSEDKKTLQRLTTFSARNLGLMDLWIVDLQSRVIASVDSRLLDTKIADNEIRKAFTLGRTQRKYVGEKAFLGFGPNDYVAFTGPLYLGNKLVGAVRFSLPLDDISKHLAGTLNVVYLYTFLDVLVIVVFGGFLLVFYVVRPLTELRRATERIIAGDFDHPIAPKYEDEIGFLAKALDNLRKTLQEKEKTVRKQMDSLEMLNQRLTSIRDQLIHTDRLAYLGRVTAGVAHEIGNPLGSIYGYLEVLKGSAEDPETWKDVIGRLESEAGRIDSIMKELLNFSRPQPEASQSVKLSTLVAECIENLESQRVFDQVEVTFEKGSDTPSVFAQPSQLKQVFLNLMINAVDAAGGEGNLEIQVTHGKFDMLTALMPMLGPEPGLESGKVAYTDQEKRGIVFSSRIPYTEGEPIVMVSVRDFGPGIEAKILKRIFEPFFTTKDKSKGTGLGLSICQRIVESTGGVLKVQSKSGIGTVFTCFFLPEKSGDTGGGN